MENCTAAETMRCDAMRKGEFIRAGKEPDESKAMSRNSHFGFAELLWGAIRTSSGKPAFWSRASHVMLNGASFCSLGRASIGREMEKVRNILL